MDNTLLDNDWVENDLWQHIKSEFGAGSMDRYFAILEELRAKLGNEKNLGVQSYDGLPMPGALRV
jgi:hypothetical protein